VLLSCLGSACAGYTGSARDLTPQVWKHERGWIAVDGVPLLRQHAEHDCGPTALAMVIGYWRGPAGTPDHGSSQPANQRVSAAELRDRARALGFSAFVVAGTLEDIAHELSKRRPVIVGVAKPSVQGAFAHYEVVVGLHPGSQRIATLDPANGWRQNSLVGFMHEWMPTGSVLLVVLPAMPTTQAAPEQTAAAIRHSAPAER
jgi:ABC-type bacteriocin/lantibiotic exporter with double-glycine peptidase domain